MNHHKKAYHLTIRSLFIAIIIIQSFIPFLGYIPLGVINLTIIQITVILAAITLGIKDGMLIGCTWGLVKLFMAYTMPNSLMDTLVFRNPIITLIPRIAVGAIAGVVFYYAYRHTSVTVASILAAISGALTNTIGVLGFMYLFSPAATASAYHTTSQALSTVLMTIAGTNGIPECIATAIIVPLLTHAIFSYTKLKPSR